MLPPWHCYERASEYFAFTCGIEQFYTTVRKLKVLYYYYYYYLNLLVLMLVNMTYALVYYLGISNSDPKVLWLQPRTNAFLDWP